MKNKKVKVVYEPEDDVLNVWLSQKLYDHAEYDDGVITHYAKDGEPVYIEILDARRFLEKNKKKDSLKAFQRKPTVAIPHKIKK